jgi:type I restriction enzyme M protein
MITKSRPCKLSPSYYVNLHDTNTLVANDVATQQDIVGQIEAEQALVNANSELITRFKQKIQASLDLIWVEELPASPQN